MSRPRVLVYVQHLLGIGHLTRAALLADACADAGLEATLVSGGRAAPEVAPRRARLVQLPLARAADESFAVVLGDTGMPIDGAWEENRRRSLLGVLTATSPDVLVIEMFPFGRRRFRFELIPLLEAAAAMTPRPRVVCSLRDILVRKRRPGRAEEVSETVERWFDHVLVHGDPTLVALDRSFAFADRLADKVRYTGYVVADPGASARDGKTEGAGVLVSAGGGAVGLGLLRAAIEARPLTGLASAPWRVITGTNTDGEGLRALAERAPAGVTVERARPDFDALLAGSFLSVSQAGYNTVATILARGVRSVLVPFAAGEENEQRLRADVLRARGLVEVVDEASLTPAALAGAIDAAAALPPPRDHGIDLSGRETSARLIADWAMKRAA